MMMMMQVTPVLLGVLTDPSESVDVRTAAFVIARDARPGYVTMQAIVHRLRREGASQLRTLMYTSLVSLAKYTGAQPALRRMYAAATVST